MNCRNIALYLDFSGSSCTITSFPRREHAIVFDICHQISLHLSQAVNCGIFKHIERVCQHDKFVGIRSICLTLQRWPSTGNPQWPWVNRSKRCNYSFKVSTNLLTWPHLYLMLTLWPRSWRICHVGEHTLIVGEQCQFLSQDHPLHPAYLPTLAGYLPIPACLPKPLDNDKDRHRGTHI